MRFFITVSKTSQSFHIWIYCDKYKEAICFDQINVAVWNKLMSVNWGRECLLLHIRCKCSANLFETSYYFSMTYFSYIETWFTQFKFVLIGAYHVCLKVSVLIIKLNKCRCVQCITVGCHWSSSEKRCDWLHGPVAQVGKSVIFYSFYSRYVRDHCQCS